MKILFITHQFPWPINSGQKIRNYQNLNSLSLDHDVDVLCTDSDEIDASYPFNIDDIIFFPFKEKSKWEIFQSHFFNHRSFYEDRFHQPDIYYWIEENHYKYDLIWLGGLQHYTNLPEGIDLNKVWLDNHNVEADLYKDYARSEKNLFKRLLLKNEHKLLQQLEFNAWDLVKANVACSKPNLSEILTHNKNTHFLPNCIDEVNSNCKKLDHKNFNIIYCGTLNWKPNEDAVQYLLDDIWPKIEDKEIHFHLIGGGLSEDLCEKIKPLQNFHYHGRVDSLDTYYSKADLVLVPLRMGSGTRLKILEAASYGLPVVSTSIGSEGLEEFSGKGLYISDDSKMMAHLIQQIKDQPKVALSKSKSMVQHFKKNFSNKANLKRLRNLVFNANAKYAH